MYIIFVCVRTQKTEIQLSSTFMKKETSRQNMQKEKEKQTDK
jgi:hypothetical protein